MYSEMYQIIQFVNFLNSFWELIVDMIPEIVGSLIGVWGAIYLFNQQTKNEKRVEKENDKSEQEEILRYSSILIQNVIETYKKESQELKIYSDNIIKKPYLTLNHIKAFATNDISRLINILNGKDYLHTYLINLGNNQESLEEFGLISNCIDYLEISRKQLEEIGDMAAKNDFERRINYNKLVIKNINKIKDYAYNNILERMDIIELLLPFNIVYGNDESLNLDQHVKLAVLPIINLLQVNYHNDPQAKKVEFELREALSIAQHVLYNNVKYGEDIEELHNDLESTISNFELNSKRLKEFTRNNTPSA